MNQTEHKISRLSYGAQSFAIVLILFPVIYLNVYIFHSSLPLQLLSITVILTSLWCAIKGIRKNQGRLIAFLTLAILAFLIPMAIG
jgi:hypothetical protein